MVSVGGVVPNRSLRSTARVPRGDHILTLNQPNRYAYALPPPHPKQCRAKLYVDHIIRIHMYSNDFFTIIRIKFYSNNFQL